MVNRGVSQGKLELFAAIRRDARLEGLSARALARKYGVHRRTATQALASPWPPPRKPLAPRGSRLDGYKPAIDRMLRADLTRRASSGTRWCGSWTG